MKLFLSSYYLGNSPASFAALFGSNKRVGIIMNAGDHFGTDKKSFYLDREIDALKAIGLTAEEVDLRDYFDNDLLTARLTALGGVWVMGGNTFILRRAMQQSGFDEIITQLVQAAEFVYGGFSAGAVVAGASLDGIQLDDDPVTVPLGYSPKVIWEGLGLCNFMVVPHYRSNHPESEAINKVVVYMTDNALPFRALRDGEAMVIETPHKRANLKDAHIIGVN